MITFRKILASTIAALAVAVFTTIGFSPAAYADPPSWSPEYGYRDKHFDKHRKKHRQYRRHRNHGYYAERRPYKNWNRGYAPSYGYTNPYSNNTLMGGLIGGILGGFTGSHIGKGDGRTAAIIGGSVLGAIVGGNIGQSMDQVDYSRVQGGLENTPSGQTIIWNNPDSGTQYKMTPTRTYKTPQNQYCREYTTWGTIGGYQERMYGTACRQPDGSWTPVN